MTGPHLTDHELPLAADVIDAIAAATTGDLVSAANLSQRLTTEQAAQIVPLLIGMTAGALNEIAALTGTPRHELIGRIRQRAAD